MEKIKRGLAIVSLCLGIVGLILSFCFGAGIILAAPALFTGIIALAKKNDGKGLAITGIILAVISIIISFSVIFTFNSDLTHI